MDIEKRRSKLLALGCEPSDMYIFPAWDGRQLLIVRRTGIEKIERLFGVAFKYISVTESSYKDGCNVTVVLQGEAVINDNKVAVQAMGSANPDTVSRFGFFADMANKRARHKIVLKIADLYQYDVHSEDESEDFKPPKQFNHENAAKEALQKISI